MSCKETMVGQLTMVIKNGDLSNVVDTGEWIMRGGRLALYLDDGSAPVSLSRVD